MAEQKDVGDQMSNLMRDKVREVKAEALAGNVKVLSRRALMDIVDQLIKNYGGLEHQDLISKIAEFELANKQLETKMATLQGKLEIYERQVSELRKEDDELRAKIKVEESRLPMLEEQNVVLKKTVEGLEAEAENLRRRNTDSEEGLKAELDRVTSELAETKAALAEAGPAIQAAEQAKSDAERRVRDAEALSQQLEEKVGQIEDAKEKSLGEFRSKIARLESALQESDARKKILSLENELSTVKSNLETLDLALEFVDVEPSPRFEEAETEMAGIDELLGKAPEEEAKQVRESLARARSKLDRDRQVFPELLGLMYQNQGSVPVVRDIVKLVTRQEDLLTELKALKVAAELL